MSVQTTVSGFIEILRGDIDTDQELLKMKCRSNAYFEYMNFSLAHCNSGSCLLSFAIRVKVRHVGWTAIRESFENILKPMIAISARLHFEESHSGKEETYLYLYQSKFTTLDMDGWYRWQRLNGININETLIVASPIPGKEKLENLF